MKEVKGDTSKIWINIESLFFLLKFIQTKTAIGNEKVLRISIEVGFQISLVGRHIEEPAVFVSAVVHISRIGSAVHHCACNPLAQNTSAHITMVVMDDANLKWTYRG